jgi:RHS repeat-associated protein
MDNHDNPVRQGELPVPGHFTPGAHNEQANNFVIQSPSISLPKGGGALRNIDEKFTINAVNGTASFSMPLPFSKTRSACAPAINLSYNSGSGNSEFGLGWSLDIPFIQRKTDKKLPLYRDAEESDIYLLSGVDDLVPVFNNDGMGNWKKAESTDNATGYTIKRYRPRIEGDFSRVEQVTPAGQSVFYWKVTDKNNIVTIYGRSAASRLIHPLDDQKVFKWMPEVSYDDKGNCFEFEYIKEDLVNINHTLCECNRLNGNAVCANLYLKRVKYGNADPYYPDLSNPYDPPVPADPGYCFETVFDFGDHDNAIPLPAIQQAWPTRLEPFSQYKSGFEKRTYRLCRRVLFFHHFKELNDGIHSAPCLVRSYDIGYLFFQNPLATAEEKRNAETDYIVSVTETGYIRQEDGSYSSKSLPPMEFSYQQPVWNKTVQEISTDSLMNDPTGLTDGYQWADLWSEGLSGILTEQANAWYYKSNLGDGNFSPATPVIPKPSLLGISKGALQLQDLEADGRKFIVTLQQGIQGYFELNENLQWQPFQSFPQMPNINFTDGNTKFIDLDGDGRAEIIISEENVFTWYPNKGVAGYDSAELAAKSYDEEKGPALIFGDASQSIYLSDMNGDGLTDIVRIRNGEICYWPNMGYGIFGAKVSMDLAPFFDTPDRFNAAYLHLADITGTGATSIIYLGNNTCRAWVNCAGNGWSAEQTFDNFPATDPFTRVSVIDLLGNGTASIVWSSALQKNESAPMRFVDLMGGQKPYIMTGYKNNFGKEMQLEYRSSTKFYLDDQKIGMPWITRLPFPVQCVYRLTVRDVVAGTLLTNMYSYHHGYYDHTEREFRGFGRVDQYDTEDFISYSLSNSTTIVEEDLHQPPVKTISWFHTGAYFNELQVLGQFEKEYNKGPLEFELPGPVLPAGLSSTEAREALRACKGTLLRREVYAVDGTPDEGKAFSVEVHSSDIRLLQPQLNNRHAVFIVHDAETLNIAYERNVNDPRISHSLNLETDEFGNVLQAAAIVYGRKSVDPSLPPEIQNEQSKAHVSYTTNDYTNFVDTPLTYRLKLPAETKTFELTRSGYDAFSSFNAAGLLHDFATAAVLPYEAAPDGSLQKRLIEDVRNIYLADDMVTPLALGSLEPLGVKYQNYRMAFTAALVNDLYAGRVTDQMLTDAGYTQADASNWWVSSGRNIYLQGVETIATAQQRFYLPVATQDPLNSVTTFLYDPYFLMISKTEDALQNTTTADRIDFRIIQPVSLKDENNNTSEILTDELGMVVATSTYGEEGDGNHGDLPLSAYNRLSPASLADAITDPHKFLQQATSFFYYDLFAWIGRSQPVCVASVTRETHESELTGGNPTKIFLSVAYSDGFGKSLQTKIQAEPGEALQWQNDNLVSIDTSPAIRWVGNGRTIYNNKANPVKQYEPFFSANFEYESEQALVEIGFTSITYYDALGRNIRTEQPNGTFSKTEFDAWKQLSFDANDTVITSSWYADRGSPAPADPEPADPEHRAAWLAVKHANTPAQQHLDSLGRIIYSIADNGAAGMYSTRFILDIENNTREIIDARNNSVIKYDYDMTSRQAHQRSMDTGDRYIFPDILALQAYKWDSRDHRFKNEYDLLHRPLRQWLKENVNDLAPEKLIQFNLFGEGQANDTVFNLRGKVFREFDQSGMTETSQYDFKNNVKVTGRQLAVEYKKVTDWNIADPTLLLETENFPGSTLFDAANRVTEMQFADGSKIHPGYNEAGLLEQLKIFVQAQNSELTFVENVDYNAKGQREKILYGNNSLTRYMYDTKTYHLTRILTTRNNGADILQDLNYTFDPVANIVSSADHAQQTIYFNNALVEASNTFEYDAVYRLIYAQGREHTGQNAASAQFDTDKTSLNNLRLTFPGDMNAMQRYEERYSYDPAGNMLNMVHNAGNGIFSNKWTRILSYNSTDNYLIQTQVGADTTGYSYDAHGNMQNLQNGAFGLSWNYADQLQQVDVGGGGTAYYVYDGTGGRMRKITENGDRVKERIYLNGMEIYREKNNNVTGLERHTIHIMDDKQRIALVELRDSGTDSGLPFLIRYQYSNHLGTASLELDANAAIISYEEYYPFGSTAYQAMRNQTETPKRYRYTGKEHDDESGLYYHSARYYAPWLVRWTAADPSGTKDGTNLFAYVKNNPVTFRDPSGHQGEPDKPFQLTPPSLLQPPQTFEERFAARLAETLVPKLQLGGSEKHDLTLHTDSSLATPPPAYLLPPNSFTSFTGTAPLASPGYTGTTTSPGPAPPPRDLFKEWGLDNPPHNFFYESNLHAFDLSKLDPAGSAVGGFFALPEVGKFLDVHTDVAYGLVGTGIVLGVPGFFLSGSSNPDKAQLGTPFLGLGAAVSGPVLGTALAAITGKKSLAKQFSLDIFNNPVNSDPNPQVYGVQSGQPKEQPKFENVPGAEGFVLQWKVDIPVLLL